MTLALPYLGLLTPLITATRCPVRITDGALAALRPGHDAATALLAIERRDPLEVLARRREPPGPDDDGRREHLALVPVDRPADIPAALGWFGPCDDVADLCAVLRSWEDRFGVYLVRLGRTSMGLSGEPDPDEYRALQA